MKLNYRIETVYPTDPVSPSRINPNVMDRGRRELLTDVVAEFGALQFPLYQDDPERPGGYVILDGHHRDAAFREAGLEEWHAVVLPADASRSDTDRARLALNHLRGSAEHNATAEILRDLRAEAPDIDLSLAGLLPGEIELLLREAPPELDLSAAIPPVGETAPEDTSGTTGVFELTLGFDSAKELKRARAILRKAAGRGNSITVGFRKIAGMEHQKT